MPIVAFVMILFQRFTADAEALVKSSAFVVLDENKLLAINCWNPTSERACPTRPVPAPASKIRASNSNIDFAIFAASLCLESMYYS